MASAELLATAKAALQEWRKSFANIRIHSVMTYGKTARAVPPGFVAHTEFVWSDTGNLQHDYTTVEGQVTHREVRISHGDKSFFLGYPKGLSKYEMPETASIGGKVVNSPGAQFRFPVRPLSGLWSAEQLWLPDVPEHFPDRITASIAEDGVPHLHWVFDDQLEFHVLLDPAHSYLPRQVEFRNVKTGVIHPINIVEEFRRLEPGGVWIPWKGHRPGDDEENWQVERAEVNQTIDQRIFEPPLVIGMKVNDDIEKLRYVHGHKPSGPPAPTPPMHWSSFLLAGATVAGLAAGVILWNNRRSYGSGPP